ncbi:PREDICTED: induced stolen tip protein TUB8 isoform X2 [Nicrophorus vespilloides]|uniref:Induced stolen tip protein TUB8 isoform X2 n=1 Tax=Nicrophorus vespilloides TaxID=110193 RepID=A0ABM1N824_NICVS|nr:PREDICTED: induced stolen tip protein TUB8 isoform X2 [Nicrophorus vespilloides]
MKFKLLLLVSLFCLLAVQARPAEDEYAEYEDEPAPPPKPTPRSNILKGRRNPLAGRAASAKPASTTTAAPVEEEEIVDEDEPVEEPVEATPSTEAPKKIKGGVRPFRSNDDLLAALKRRREQAANIKSQPKAEKHEEESQAAAEPAVSKARATSGRKRFNTPKNVEAAASQDEPATSAPVRSGRRFSTRN